MGLTPNAQARVVERAHEYFVAYIAGVKLGYMSAASGEKPNWNLLSIGILQDFVLRWPEEEREYIDPEAVLVWLKEETKDG